MASRTAENRSVIERISATTGVPVDEVERQVSACHDAVDELIADDFSIIAPPLTYATSSDPVFAALANRLETCTDEEAETCLDWQDDELAVWLGVTVEMVRRHPMASENYVVFSVLDRLGLASDDDLANWPHEVRGDAELALSVVRSWVDTYADHRPYRVGPAGLERDFETWLIDHLDRLADHGYPVRLQERGRQHRLNGGRLIPDLVCRFTQRAGTALEGDWLVIENKATPGYIEAGDQVARYVVQARAELVAPGEQVFGLLVADGASARIQQHLESLEVGYVSLASLGYRRREWSRPAMVRDHVLDRLPR